MTEANKNLEAVHRSVRAVTAPRSYLFDDPDVERLLDMVLSLTAELSVTQERLDSLERLLGAKQVVSQQEVESYQVSQEVSEQRLANHDALIARVLRILHQDVAEMETAAQQMQASAKDSGQDANDGN